MTNKERLNIKRKLLDAISYSRQYEGYLTTAEIILVHQHMQRGLGLTNKIKTKIEHITNLIQLTKWERPITRFNSELQQEQLNTKTGNWQIVKSVNNTEKT